MATRARGMLKSVHSPEQLAFLRLLVEARKKAGLTQEELAKRLKRPQSFVAKYEGGERRLDVLEFITITQAMGSDPIRLLKTLIRQLR
jgi:transcriptional regulator with XRE-family HTH domain